MATWAKSIPLLVCLLYFSTFVSPACKKDAMSGESRPVPYDKYALAELPSETQFLVRRFIKKGLNMWNSDQHDGRQLRSSDNVLTVFAQVKIWIS